MFHSNNNDKLFPSISKKNEEIIINVLSTLITILISIILYFILAGCYNEMDLIYVLKIIILVGLIIFLFYE